MIVASVRDLTFTHTGAARAALNGVSLDLRAGEVVLIEGPSGCGKSTLLRALAGLVPHFHGGTFRGSVVVDGLDTRSTPTAQIARRVGVLFQDPETQAVRSTVGADVAFGPEHLGLTAATVRDRVADALLDTRAVHLTGREVATLSGGERQRAALAAVLANAPAVLLLDEPTSQLDAAAVRALDDVVTAQAARGVAVVITEHHAHRLATAFDRVIRLEEGRIVQRTGDGPAPPAVPAVPGATLLDGTDLTVALGGRPVLRRCAIRLAAGTVTALAGDNGAGKSTLLRTLVGLQRPDRGAVVVCGREVTADPVESRLPTMGFLPQDAGRRLIHERVRDELLMPVAGLGLLERERRLARVCDELDLAALLARHPLDLSVGERERVALGVVLMAAPQVILLDEPTRGMDAEHRATLVTAVRRRAADGAAVLVATHDPHFAGAVADVHVAMREGVVVDESVAAAR